MTKYCMTVQITQRSIKNEEDEQLHTVINRILHSSEWTSWT